MRRAAGEEAGRPRRGRHAVLRFQRRRASDGGRAKEGGRRRAGGEGRGRTRFPSSPRTAAAEEAPPRRRSHAAPLARPREGSPPPRLPRSGYRPQARRAEPFAASRRPPEPRLLQPFSRTLIASAPREQSSASGFRQYNTANLHSMRDCIRTQPHAQVHASTRTNSEGVIVQTKTRDVILPLKETRRS